jgi:mono/diheme cytochrome c family protein
MRRARAAIMTGLVLCGCASACAGADLPPAGRSLFDHLTQKTIDGRSVQHIAYPFAALLAELERHAGTDALGRPGIAAVLIPLGRSLQRNASAGDYFRHPRVVVAVTGEARMGDAPRLMLRDRLFLGFQDEAGVIEVISYNEQAGRFEFQVVDGYRAGETPRVRYARRAVCSACHQAAAPIFSRPGWDETNANPAVARALAVHATAFHGVAVKRGVDVPNAIDDSVARANQIALAQSVWRSACDAVRTAAWDAPGQPPDDPPACRGALLTAALERRLGSRTTAAASRARLVPLAAAWQSVWPQGIPVPDPNIPNRDPFFGQAQQLAHGAPRAPWGADEVVPALDPMSARGPIDAWRGDARGLEAVLHALGGFFAAADVQALERALAGASFPPRSAKAGVSAPSGAADIAPGSDSGSRPNRDEHAGSFPALASAVAVLAADTRAGRSDVLASAPFRRATILRALFRALGTNAEISCCDDPSPAMAPAELESAQAARPASIPDGLQPFYAHCSACHSMPTASPPGFLHGTIETVERNIARCAPRIRFRLAMWQAAPGARTKTPMPPPVFVPAWEQAAPRADIARMIDYATRALPANAAGSAPAGGYETLPPCRQQGLETRAVPAPG